MLLDDPDIDLRDRKRFLGIIVSETERLTRLVNQVLDMAKIESGHAEWHNGEIEPVEVIEQAAASTSQLFKDKGVALEMALPDRCRSCIADATG
jgi:signal transduction histidine kinase